MSAQLAVISVYFNFFIIITIMLFESTFKITTRFIMDFIHLVLWASVGVLEQFYY